ncbi:MAG TPA: hypothetical protein VLR90_07770 [Blastocatellia bacterium]|nr:hypothetical protein [Blastocatellia bacterium]
MKITRAIKMSICAMLIFVAAISLTIISQSVVRAKDKSNVNLTTSADLDHAFVQGATVKYQLLDEEIQGAPLFYSNGTIVRRFNAEIIVDYIPIDARTDEQGRRLFRLKIDRPDILGGPFEKDAPHDSGRDPGTFDSLSAGDLVH